MILRLNCPVKLDRNDKTHITGLTSPLGRTWDHPVQRTKRLKAKIRQQLDSIQHHCAYCGLELGGTSAGDIEHIAAKGSTRHPEFTYEEYNLVLACNFCNGPKKKFQKETIEIKNAVYSNCRFLIVHPYFDEPNDHFSWVDNSKRIVIKSISTKGAASINMFQLDTPKMTRFRAVEYNSYVRENDLVLDKKSEYELKLALKYK